MNLNGSLDAFGLPDVFALLAMTGKSGGLRLRRTAADRTVEGVVWFHDGRVSGASADCAREGLVRRLVGSGIVDDAALSTAVARAGTSPVGVARALLEAGAVEPELVREAAVDQAVDAVFDLGRWPDGEFGFEQGTRNIDDVGVALEHTWLIAEATARRAAWDGLQQVIPSVDSVVSLPVVLDGDPHVSREEWALLALVDGRRTVADLVELTGAGVFAVVTVLAGLAGRGMLTVLEPGGVDHATAVQRRLAVLAAAESDSPVVPAVAAAPVAVEDEPVVEVPAPGGLSASAALAAARTAQALSASQPGAPVRDIGRPAVADRPAPERVADRPAARREVVPPRPEPFLPGRRPEHPEQPAVSQSPGAYPTTGTAHLATAGNTAMVPAIAPDPTAVPAGTPGIAGQGIIERDPAVNRSLLLRLIAGVRGL